MCTRHPRNVCWRNACFQHARNSVSLLFVLVRKAWPIVCFGSKSKTNVHSVEHGCSCCEAYWLELQAQKTRWTTSSLPCVHVKCQTIKYFSVWFKVRQSYFLNQRHRDNEMYQFYSSCLSSLFRGLYRHLPGKKRKKDILANLRGLTRHFVICPQGGGAGLHGKKKMDLRWASKPSMRTQTVICWELLRATTLCGRSLRLPTRGFSSQSYCSSAFISECSWRHRSDGSAINSACLAIEAVEEFVLLLVCI